MDFYYFDFVAFFIYIENNSQNILQNIYKQRA